MRLFEAIVDANNRAIAGDKSAGLHPSEFADSMPVAALTCIDARLNPLIPEVLGVPEEKFIWLRNAGNIITSPLSSTMRSLAMACAIKGGREIVVIGHTDCLVCKTTTMSLTEALRSLGVDRSRLPENLNEYFGLFASERQNVLKAVETIRGSPLIGPKIPVHGLLLDIASGKLEWLVNGYRALEQASSAQAFASAGQQPAIGSNPLTALPAFNIGEMKFPEVKIGEISGAIGKDVADIKLPEFKVSPATLPETKVPDFKISEVKQPEYKPVTPVAAEMRTVERPKYETKPVTATAKQLSTADLELRFDKSKRYKIIGSDQKMYGPISGAKVLQWISEDRIDWQTPAQIDGSTEWKPLYQFAGGAPPPIIPLPPPIESASQRGQTGKRRY